MSEQRLLSYETRGYLTELLVSGVVSHEEIESVIETLNEYMIEEATIEDVDSIMIGLRTLDISNHDGAEDSVEFKVRYIQ